VTIPFPSGSRLSAATATRYDVTGTEDVTVFTGRTTPTEGAVPVIYCHGLLGTGTDEAWLDTTRAGDDFAPIAAWGHPVFVPNIGGTLPFGNPASLAAVEAIITWAHNDYGTRTDWVAFAGESAGAPTALMAGAANPGRVAAMWLRVPCLGVEWTRNNVAALTASVDGAFGGSVSEAEYDAADPMRNITTIRRFRHRARIWATASDELFPLAVTAGFAGQLGIDLDVIGGTHADGYDTPPFLVAQWLDQTIRS
jgi:acetyl esterase/lipase